jgi:ligand-binding sensor domain-containing protein
MPAKGFVALARLFLAAILLTTLSRAAGPALNPDFTDALWIAESERVLKVARAEGSVLFEIPEAGAVTALAIDASHTTLWAYGQNTLYAYDFSGQRRLRAPLPSASTVDDEDEDDEDDDVGTAIRLAVDPNDGSVWLGRHKYLYHLDAQGQVLTTAALDKTLQGLSFDPSRGQVWVATKKHLSAYDALGQRVKHLSPNGSSHLNDIVYDPLLDALWVADHPDRIRRYGAEEGALQLEVKVTKHPEILDPDHQGGLWVS